MSAGLDRRSRILRDRLRRAINALDAYERLLLSGEMGGPDAPAKRTHALELIHRCVRDAANIAGISPIEKRKLLSALANAQEIA
jgi:hypothetical protein